MRSNTLETKNRIDGIFRAGEEKVKKGF